MNEITKSTAKFRDRWNFLSRKPFFDPEATKLYMGFFKEELETELGEAASKNNNEALAHVLDCLCDAGVFMGHYAAEVGILGLLPLAWQEVERSNSTKGGDTLADENGKWIKGPSYKKPDLSPLFEAKVIVLLTGIDQRQAKVMLEALRFDLGESTASAVSLRPEGLFLNAASADDTPVLPKLIKALGRHSIKVTFERDEDWNWYLKGHREEDASSYQDWVKEVAMYKGGLTYTGSGLAAEAGEFLAVINKSMRRLMKGEVHAGDLTDDAHNKALDELSDVVFFVVANANELGVTIEQLMKINRLKINKRIAEGTVFQVL